MSGNLIGQVLLNQFRVDAFVASGGMGAVYKVWDLKRNVPLAMKTLHPELAEDPAVFKRFKREARALQKLTHPNIVPFYGLYQTHDFAFLLEAYIDGHSLRDILRSRNGQPLLLSEVLVYLKALSAALGFAHAHDVVHCDVKPANVMLDQGGNIFLTDFGIARHADSTSTTMATVGTAAYMAPEQVRGEPVNAASDVYALGVMLFEMLTGARPFRGTESGTESAGATANERIRFAHLHLPPPDPRSLQPDIPESIASVIQKSLAKTPSERYSSTNDLLVSILEAAGINLSDIPDRASLGIPKSTLRIPQDTVEFGISSSDKNPCRD
jgi:serine/threonine protein kinase